MTMIVAMLMVDGEDDGGDDNDNNDDDDDDEHRIAIWESLNQTRETYWHEYYCCGDSVCF
jgi:hypothetical protein